MGILDALSVTLSLSLARSLSLTLSLALSDSLALARALPLSRSLARSLSPHRWAMGKLDIGPEASLFHVLVARSCAQAGMSVLVGLFCSLIGLF
jgi:hypothetical protein